MGKRIVLGAAAILLVIAAAYASFYVAPEERTMGVLQRIFYFHVSSAWAGMDAFFLCFIANLLYVWKRDQKYDWLGVSAAEVGLVLTTVVLITGPIWAKPAWGIYWTWDARLTSTFVLWLLYVSYLLLRTLIEEAERRALLSALFGIFAFIDVPLVFFSIRWWRTQHPAPVIMGSPGSGLDPTMNKVFLFSVFAMHVFAAFLIVERYVLEKLRSEVDLLRREVEAQ
ncbi:MAG TPA: cytochrome c biogenesis protein [Candidatus Dormibacteraeota bacterium]|nr:cytochrome c biogenesis protein [Candidatus Dormibacteraeota bacterium]